MTNKEFLLEVQKSCHAEMPRCLMLMGSLQKMLGNAAVDQIAVVLSNLGVFTSHKHPEYVQEDSQTGAMTLYPPRITYHFQSEQNAEGTPCAALLAEYAHVEQEEASSFVDAVVQTINHHLQAGEEIEVPGIGTFKNVLTHHSDLQHIDFLPCDQMKELVNAPFACFESYEISAGKTLAPEVEEQTENTTVETVEETSVEAVEETPVETIEETPAIEPVIPGPEEKESEVPEPEVEAQIVAAVTPEPQPVAAVVTPDLAEKKEVPVSEPIITVHRDGHIVIQDEDEVGKNSINWTLCISLTLIMMGCGFLLWLMFSDDVRFWDDQPTEAKVVEVDQPNSSPVYVAPNKAEEPPVEVVAQEEPKKEEPVTLEPVKVEPAKEEPRKVDSSKEEPRKADPIKEETRKADPVPTKEEPVKPAAKEFHRMKGADGKEVKVTLQAGGRLTLIALEHFGDKAFWPYIFDVNTDKLKAPNLVQSGMSLYLPDPAYYDIDAKNPESVRKAKNRAAQLLK